MAYTFLDRSLEFFPLTQAKGKEYYRNIRYSIILELRILIMPFSIVKFIENGEERHIAAY